ncbi:hypothetical protein [Nostoc sp. WHI]|uniref:hypothetical protein n=1 Tax=Nostoc sp. WHI TaxID=2650611 RepID=UPI001E6133C5|nr:hypothetical protein [Nostoc sp. WHI]MBG1265519.1 hypothetical protein [Nostoc sp. WHI]
MSTLPSLLFPLTEKLVEFWVRASNRLINRVPRRLLSGLKSQASVSCTGIAAKIRLSSIAAKSRLSSIEQRSPLY